MQKLEELKTKLSGSIKDRLLSAHNIEYVRSDRKEVRRAAQNEALEAHMIHTGVSRFFESLHKSELKTILSADEPKYTSKAAYVKTVQGLVERDGLEKFLQTCGKATLETIAPELSDEKDEDELRSAIMDKIVETGIENFFHWLDPVLLYDVAKALGHTVSKAHHKQQLLEAITTGHISKVAKKVSKVPKVSKHKPDIEKGVSAADLHQYYNIEDLVKWCKEHKLKQIGVKKVVIQRIIGFLNGETDGLASERTKRKRRKTSPGTKRKTKAKAKKPESGSEEEGTKPENEEAADKPSEAEPGSPSISSTVPAEEPEGPPEAPKPAKSGKPAEPEKPEKPGKSKPEKPETAKPDKTTKPEEPAPKGKSAKKSDSDSSEEETKTKSKSKTKPKSGSSSKPKSSTTTTKSTSSKTRRRGKSESSSGSSSSSSSSRSDEEPAPTTSKRSRKGT